MNRDETRLWRRGEENLELFDGDVEVEPPLGSRVWRNHEEVDNAG